MDTQFRRTPVHAQVPASLHCTQNMREVFLHIRSFKGIEVKDKNDSPGKRVKLY